MYCTKLMLLDKVRKRKTLKVSIFYSKTPLLWERSSINIKPSGCSLFTKNQCSACVSTHRFQFDVDTITKYQHHSEAEEKLKQGTVVSKLKKKKCVCRLHENFCGKGIYLLSSLPQSEEHLADSSPNETKWVCLRSAVEQAKCGWSIGFCSLKLEEQVNMKQAARRRYSKWWKRQPRQGDRKPKGRWCSLTAPLTSSR